MNIVFSTIVCRLCVLGGGWVLVTSVKHTKMRDPSDSNGKIRELDKMYNKQ